jgi:hypothetical protein
MNAGHARLVLIIPVNGHIFVAKVIKHVQRSTQIKWLRQHPRSAERRTVLYPSASAKRTKENVRETQDAAAQGSREAHEAVR